MANMGITQMERELRRLNPNIYIEVAANPYDAIFIVRCSDCAQLRLPKGYSYNSKNRRLMNENNTTSGQYENFRLMTQYEYFTELA